MGRVAKYKKVKSFDPYSKKNKGNVDLGQVGVWGLGDNGRRVKKRSLKAGRMQARKNKIKSESKSTNKFVDHDEGFDAPPIAKDEFNMTDMVGSIKRQKVQSNEDASSMTTNNKKATRDESYDKIVTSTGNVASIPKTAQDESKVTRLLRLDKQEEQKSEKEKQLGHARMQGESKNAFNKRTRAETRQIIKNSTATTKNHEKLQRKKEFLKNKKKNKKRKGGGGMYSYNNDEDSDGDAYDNETSYSVKGAGKGKDSLPADEPVRFGEQAERPPTFRQIPRGAKAKSNTTTQAAAKAAAKTEGMSEPQIEAERDSMELMRRRVQAQYKAIKYKRKTGGDFHL